MSTKPNLSTRPSSNPSLSAQTALHHAALDTWINRHFEEEVRFLQALVQVPTDTPPGNNAPHAEQAAALLADFGFAVEKHPVPAAEVAAAGLESITNLVVRVPFGAAIQEESTRKQSTENQGRTIALNAHGDVVPPGEGWTHAPYGAEIADGAMYGRAAAVSKSDFASYTFALRALQALVADSTPKNAPQLQGAVELHFTYDEEFGGELGPGWLLKRGIVKPDLLIAAGFSYAVVTAHNGCLQMEVTVHGQMAHAAIPHTGVDALQAAVAILQALYAQNNLLKQITSSVPGIGHPYLNVGQIAGGTNTNVVPGKVSFKLDRRMIPEENPESVEADISRVIADAAASQCAAGITVEVRRLLLARAMQPTPESEALAAVVQHQASAVFGEAIEAIGTPLYTDARLYAEAGIPSVIYGAGPRTVLESHAKRADERLQLEDLRRATQVIARSLYELLRV